MLDLSVIILNMNRERLLQECLESLYRRTEGISFEVIVVDNASTDGSVEMVKRKFPQVILIENDENLGFTKANNQGIRIARGKYILLLNNDTKILDNSLKKLVQFMETNEDAGVVGCRLKDERGSDQISFARHGTFLTEFLFFAFFIIKSFDNPITNWKLMKNVDSNRTLKVDWVSGCFFAVRRDVFHRIGLLDENIFAYYEDDEFCHRVNTLTNYAVYFYPEISILHYGQMTLRDENVHLVKIAFNSVRYYFSKIYAQQYARNFKLAVQLAWFISLALLIFAGFATLFRSRKVLKKIELLTALVKSQFFS